MFLEEAAIDRNHRLELQYEGTGLHGWAKQPGLLTVEGCLEAAFLTVLGRVPEWEVAGRTDAGVHARRQVLSVRLPEGLDLDRLRYSLNALTPPQVAVVHIRPAPASFNARSQARSRVYRYFLATGPAVSPFWSRYSWHVPVELDWQALTEAAGLVVGTHDFTAFTPTETEHVLFRRKVTVCRWRRARGGLCGLSVSNRGGALAFAHPGGQELFYLEIEAEAFLRHMVRTLVGTMVEVAKGDRDLAGFASLLEGAPRAAAGPTAPPQGLFLWDVKYRRLPAGEAALQRPLRRSG